MSMLIQGQKRTSWENMSLDERLLAECKPGDPLILHLYEWQRPSLTFGYFMRLEDLLNIERLNAHGIDYARRPTGGGVIFHIWDVAFSIIVPSDHPFYFENTLECYGAINGGVKKAISKVVSNLDLLSFDPKGTGASNHFCMAKPTIYDVMLGGRKVAGAAQRKKKNGLLHQGTISVEIPDFDLLKELLLDQSVVEQIQMNTVALGTKALISESLVAQFLEN